MKVIEINIHINRSQCHKTCFLGMGSTNKHTFLECHIHSSEDGDDNPEASFHFQASSSLPHCFPLQLSVQTLELLAKRITLLPGP